MKLTTLERLAGDAGRRFLNFADARIVLAHGCFDVVHPGHIRHLQWAKAQGDVLVCSVTSDRFIHKGADRPWVPELLRCENVAALECVDYVLLTDAPDAVELIERLKPDVFVKGFEYRFHVDVVTKAEQIATVAGGGCVAFSPADVVYSSTELGPPGITLPDFSGLRVHVIGDAIRDVYTQARCLGAASKSPTLVYAKGESQEWIGGAGVVAEHCRAAGAQVTLTTAGATVKERILVDGVKVLEFHARPGGRLPVTWVKEAHDVVIFADFQHGVFTRETIANYLHVWRDPGMVSAADSQVSGTAWGNILDFKGCDLLFANEREARFALRDQTTEDIGPAFWEAAHKGGSHATFLKLGSRGLRIYDGTGPRVHAAVARQPIVDPIGAGDALLAYATLTYAVTKDLELAGQIGSLAAAEACAHLGNVPVTRAQVQARSWR